MSAGVDKTRLIEVLTMTLVPDNSVRRSAELELSRVCGVAQAPSDSMWRINGSSHLDATLAQPCSARHHCLLNGDRFALR